MIPSKFKAKPDSNWLPWTSGSVDNETLRHKIQKVPTFVNGCQVTMLQFSNGTTWDVFKGWTESIKTD